MGRVMTQTAITLHNPDGPNLQRERGLWRKPDWLKNKSSKYGENYKSSYEVAAQHILNLIQTDSDIDLSTLKKEISKDYFY
jgi:hypothetical protein